jgi:hypothetical protein
MFIYMLADKFPTEIRENGNDELDLPFRCGRARRLIALQGKRFVAR